MLEILYKRRSIRQFTDEKITVKNRERLIEALLLSPSSRNRRPWRFLIIEDKELIRKAAGAKAHGTAALNSAPMAIVVIGLTDISDVWIEDCSIASIIVQLEAESLGLGSCWIQIRKRETLEGGSSEDFLKKLLRLEESETVESIIAVGHPAESHAAYDREDLDRSKIEII